MKACCGLISVATVLVLSGCGKEENSPPPPSAPAAAPSGYLGSMVTAQQKAVKSVDATSINQEIQLFNVQEGRNPNDLNELVTKHYLGALPDVPVGMKLVYDSAQGKASIIAQ